MTEAPLNRLPYCRHSEDDWREIEALYRAGATAKSLAAKFGGCERQIYRRAQAGGWLRKHRKTTRRAITPKAAEAKARAISGVEADAPVRALAADADLSAAMRAAVRTTVGMLRGGDTTRAYAYGRLAALMLRLDRALDDGGAVGAGGRTPQQETALAAILARLGVEG